MTRAEESELRWMLKHGGTGACAEDETTGRMVKVVNMQNFEGRGYDCSSWWPPGNGKYGLYEKVSRVNPRYDEVETWHRVVEYTGDIDRCIEWMNG